MYHATKTILQRLTTVIEHVMVRREEARARAYGWHITRTGYAKRLYRDPRCDQIAARRDYERRAS